MIPNTPMQTLTPLPDYSTKPSSGHSIRRKAHGGASEEFLTAFTALAERNELDTGSWKPAVATSRLVQRHLGLQLVGLSLAEDDLMHAIKQ